MREGLVGLGHAVGVLALLDAGARRHLGSGIAQLLRERRRVMVIGRCLDARGCGQPERQARRNEQREQRHQMRARNDPCGERVLGRSRRTSADEGTGGTSYLES